MNRPPLATNGIYARYRALLSLIVSVSRPGLLIPDLEFVSFAIVLETVPSAKIADSKLSRSGTSRCARKLPQQLLQCQRAIDRGQSQSPQFIGGIQHLQQECNIHV